MRNWLFNLKIIILSAVLILNSCLKEDPLQIDNGIYIKGKATAFNNFDEGGLMVQAINEVNGEPRTGLYEIYLAVSAESDGFNIVEVVDDVQTVYGSSNKENIVLNGENGQIYGTIEKGLLETNSGVFRVSENGMYHIIIDKQTNTYVISPVTNLTLFGNTSNEEWSDTEIPLISRFDKSNIIYEASGLDLKEGEFRIRYGYGDKIELTANEVAVHTSFGGEISGLMPGFELSMIPGGNNYPLEKEIEGTYTVDVNWTVGEGFFGQMNETSTSSYPQELFMIGDGVSELTGEDAWKWDLNNFQMIPVYSNPHLFWKIVWLNENGSIRFAPQKGPEDDFGKEGDVNDELYNIGEQDIPVPGEANYYMVAVNFQTNQISISRPQVYVIGDVIGSWDTQNVEGLFTVDQSNKLITFWKAIQTGNIKMYAWHSKGWFTHWWNAEFNVYSGQIKYSTDGFGLENVYLTAATYKIYLDFRTNEGIFEKCTTCSK